MDSKDVEHVSFQYKWQWLWLDVIYECNINWYEDKPISIGKNS